MMKIEEAIECIGGLSKPSKMPSFSYSLPASECKMGKILRNVPDSVCSKCYSVRGNYCFPCVKNALSKRFASINNPLWVDSFVFIIKHKNIKYFRFHDSGDIQSMDHLKKIVQIAKECPDCKFWLPTKEYNFVMDYIDKRGIIPSNLNIRLSGYFIDGDGPTKLAKSLGCTTSTVVKDKTTATCKAYANGGKCGICRMCWNKKVMNISYPKH